MKGLILTHMGRREEGLELVKKGVRLDLTSHIVWHVFGLIQKGEKNYEEALKSYTQALRWDKVHTGEITIAVISNNYAYIRKILTSSEMQPICRLNSDISTNS